MLCQSPNFTANMINHLINPGRLCLTTLGGDVTGHGGGGQGKVIFGIHDEFKQDGAVARFKPIGGSHSAYLYY